MISLKTGKDGLAERVMSEFSIVYTSATSQLQKLTGSCQYSIPCLLEYP